MKFSLDPALFLGVSMDALTSHTQVQVAKTPPPISESGFSSKDKLTFTKTITVNNEEYIISITFKPSDSAKQKEVFLKNYGDNAEKVVNIAINLGLGKVKAPTENKSTRNYTVTAISFQSDKDGFKAIKTKTNTDGISQASAPKAEYKSKENDSETKKTHNLEKNNNLGLMRDIYTRMSGSTVEQNEQHGKTSNNFKKPPNSSSQSTNKHSAQDVKEQVRLTATALSKHGALSDVEMRALLKGERGIDNNIPPSTDTSPSFEETVDNSYPEYPPPAYEELVDSSFPKDLPPAYEEPFDNSYPDYPPPAYEEPVDNSFPKDLPPKFELDVHELQQPIPASPSLNPRTLPNIAPASGGNINETILQNLLAPKPFSQKPVEEINQSIAKLCNEPFTALVGSKSARILRNLEAQNNPFDVTLTKELKIINSFSARLINSKTDTNGKSLQELASSICEKFGVTTEDMKKEGDLFGISPEMAALKMAKKGLLYEKAGLDRSVIVSMKKRIDISGYELSEIKLIEKLFKKTVDIGGQERAEIKKEDTHVIISNTDGKFSLLLEGKILGAGTFKASRLARDYFGEKVSGDRAFVVTLKPKVVDNVMVTAYEVRKKAQENQNNKNIQKKDTSGNSAMGVKENLDKSSSSEDEVESGNPFSTSVTKEEDGNPYSTSVTKEDEVESGNPYSTSVTKENEIESGNPYATSINNEEEGGEGVDPYSSTKENALATSAINEEKSNSSPTGEVGDLFNSKENVLKAEKINADRQALLQKHKVPLTNYTLREMEYLLKSAVIDSKDIAPLQKLIEKRKNDIEIEKKARKMSAEKLYHREIEIAQSFSGKDGFMKVHSVANITGNERIIVQELAGFKLPSNLTKNNENPNVIELEDMINLFKNDKLSPDGYLKLVDIMDDSFKAVNAFHLGGYIHRDIKPANFLVKSNGNGALTDFGTAAKLEGDVGKARFGGSAFYCSPEVLKGEYNNEMWDNINGKTDVWSCGMMLFQTFVARGLEDHPLFEGIEDITDRAISVKYAELNKLGSIARGNYEKNYTEPDDPFSFEHLAWSAIQIDPDNRPTMAEFTTRFNNIKNKIIQEVKNEAPGE